MFSVFTEQFQVLHLSSLCNDAQAGPDLYWRIKRVVVWNWLWCFCLFFAYTLKNGSSVQSSDPPTTLRLWVLKQFILKLIFLTNRRPIHMKNKKQAEHLQPDKSSSNFACFSSCASLAEKARRRSVSSVLTVFLRGVFWDLFLLLLHIFPPADEPSVSKVCPLTVMLMTHRCTVKEFSPTAAGKVKTNKFPIFFLQHNLILGQRKSHLAKSQFSLSWWSNISLEP